MCLSAGVLGMTKKQLRKLDNERSKFILAKRSSSQKRDHLIESLKKERNQLQERLNAITSGPHAQQELKVRIKINILTS